MLSRDTKYIINPHIRIRHNETRCIAYSVDDFFLSVDNITILSSADAIFLLLFDGSRIVEQVGTDFEYLFSHKIDVDGYFLTLKKRFHDYDLLLDSSLFSESEIARINDSFDVKSLIIPIDKADMKEFSLRLDYPLSINFNVSTKCAFKCLYCYHPLQEIEPYIPLERLKAIFRELKDMGAESIMLTGGDPMLRSDIDDIMVALYKIGLPYTFSTKSILPYNRLKKLRDNAGLKNLQLSLDSFNSETVSKLIGTQNNYVRKFIDMVKDIHALGLNARVKCVLTRYNADEIEDYLDNISALGLKHAQIVSYGRSGYRHSDDLFPTENQLNNVTEIVRKWKEKHKDIDFSGSSYEVTYLECIQLKEISDENIMAKRTICNAGRFSLTVLPDGKVTICEHLPYSEDNIIGDLNVQSVHEMWNGKKVKEWLSPPSRETFSRNSPCRTCKDEWYKPCHTFYSRCLRFTREIFGNTNTCDIKCPFAEFDKVRLT